MDSKISGPTLGQQILAEGPIFGGTMVETMYKAGQAMQGVVPVPAFLTDLRDGLICAPVAILVGGPLGLLAGIGAMFTEPAKWGTHNKDGDWVPPDYYDVRTQVDNFIMGPDSRQAQEQRNAQAKNK